MSQPSASGRAERPGRRRLRAGPKLPGRSRARGGDGGSAAAAPSGPRDTRRGPAARLVAAARPAGSRPGPAGPRTGRGGRPLPGSARRLPSGAPCRRSRRPPGWSSASAPRWARPGPPRPAERQARLSSAERCGNAICPVPLLITTRRNLRWPGRTGKARGRKCPGCVWGGWAGPRGFGMGRRPGLQPGPVPLSVPLSVHPCEAAQSRSWCPL